LVLVIGLFRQIEAAVEEAWRGVTQAVQRTSDAAADAVPDWIKDLWDDYAPEVPAPEDFAIDKFCALIGVEKACAIAKTAGKNLNQLQVDADATEQICRSSPAVVRQFGTGEANDPGVIKFCVSGAFKNVQRSIDAVADAVEKTAVESVTSELSNYFVTDAASLDVQPYFDCLTTAALAAPNVDAASCDADPAIKSDPHKWRLCMEFHMQLPLESLGQPPAELRSEIVECRMQAVGTPP
jgi:hypothetical protein